MLARVGLLDLLEVHVFSDEIRVPKPHARAFTFALEALQAPSCRAIYVGDIRRTDVADALAVGRRAIRFRGCHDDAGLHAQSRTGHTAQVSDCDFAGCDPGVPEARGGRNRGHLRWARASPDPKEMCGAHRSRRAKILANSLGCSRCLRGIFVQACEVTSAITPVAETHASRRFTQIRRFGGPSWSR
jgi:hypothetical protein